MCLGGSSDKTFWSDLTLYLSVGLLPKYSTEDKIMNIWKHLELSFYYSFVFIYILIVSSVWT